MALLSKPEAAFDFFKEQANRNLAAMEKGLMPEGCVFFREGLEFPPRKLDGINLVPVILPEPPLEVMKATGQ
jgi:hypothetical protein